MILKALVIKSEGNREDKKWHFGMAPFYLLSNSLS